MTFDSFSELPIVFFEISIINKNRNERFRSETLNQQRDIEPTKGIFKHYDTM